MPRQAAKKLHTTTLKSLKPKEKAYSVYGGGGLLLRVKPTGVKTWTYNYYHPITKKRTNYSFGDFPTLSVDDAEAKAREFKQQVSEGIDPKRKAEKDKQARIDEALDTFKVHADKYFAIKRLKLKESTIKKWERYLEKDVFPAIGDFPVSQLEYKDGAKVRDKIIARGSFDIARKVCNYMNQIMLYTNVKPNPFEDLTKNIEWPDSENQKSIEPERLPELMKAISMSNMDMQTRLLVEFQLLTMVRPKNAVQIEWIDIDFDNALWTIPPHKMKGKKGKESEHRVPLSTQALEILKHMKMFNSNSNWVFASKYADKGHVNPETANKGLQRTALKGQIVAHGLRNIATDTCKAIGGFEHLVVEVGLAHKVGDKTTQAYTRTDFLERRRIMMQWWGDWVEHAKTGELMPAGGKQHLRVVNN